MSCDLFWVVSLFDLSTYVFEIGLAQMQQSDTLKYELTEMQNNC